MSGFQGGAENPAVASGVKDAVRWRLIGFNPAEDADAPAPTLPRPRAWTPEQVGAFLAEAGGDRWAAMWRLAATTGLRRGELAGLRWEDLDLDGGELVVAENRVVVNHRVHTGTPKGNRARRIGLDPATVEALRGWVDIKIVAGRLGHSSTRITHDIYTAVVPSMDAAAAQLVAGLYDTRP